ncbi:hypothetical protein Tsubulata_040607 [Turnera subulata]|uniref:Essential protein Yae1 N-terminal domain-containing protein n=1 Tax=Turnera subulata TaxID=218843 RepID=A0A9Q0FK41_9ROSI|nr:hypothetical protein Tsubulata_040607 [Turnera subulata]
MEPNQSTSIDDIFKASLNLEDTHFKEGYEEGYSHGLASGKEDAQQMGLKMGFETGEELGFYRGCVDVWNAVIRVDPTRFSRRVQGTVKQIGELLDKYPLLEPEEERVQELMEALRLKFRIIRAGLGVGARLEYDGGDVMKLMLAAPALRLVELNWISST